MRTIESLSDCKWRSSAKIGHDGGDDARPGKEPIVPPAFRDHCEQLVAIDNMSLLVNDNDAVAVAIKRNADIGAHLAHFAAQRVGRRRTAFAVDVEAVGLDSDRDDISAELPERIRAQPGSRRHARNRSQPADLQARDCAAGALGEFDVAVVDAVDPFGAAEFASFGEALGDIGVDQMFDVMLDLIGELVAVGPKKLDAIVVELGYARPKIMTPRSARIERVSMATAGVGIGPSSSTSMPTEVKPATSAVSIM